MNEAMWKFLKPFVIERLGEVFVDSKEYNQAVEREALCFEQLKKNLNEKQRVQLDEYFNAMSSKAALCEELAYKQGMKDLINFIGELIFNK